MEREGIERGGGWRRPGGARDEVVIGARARRRRRRRVVTAAAGLVLLAGALGLYAALRPPSGASAPGTYPVRLRCSACGREETARVTAATAGGPRACGACGQRAMREVWACAACGTEFVAADGVEVQRCPSCGGVRVGSAAARR